jgi:hypothetical protein
MSRKRRNTSSPEASPPPPLKRVSPPRAAFNSAVKNASTSAADSLAYDDAAAYDSSVSSPDPQSLAEKPHVSAHYGQTGAFPGLDGEDQDEPFYGPASDGLAYLRMVRSEALGVPGLLKAPAAELGTGEQVGEDEAEEENGVGGYWEDETFIGAPSKAVVESESRYGKAQLRYHENLLVQFKVLQATLRCTPPLEKVRGLGKDVLISLPSGSEKALEKWKTYLKEKDPVTVQIASVDGETLWELVRLLQELLEDDAEENEEEITKWGAWCWAVLGRCPGRGECGAEEVAELRSLARAAVVCLQQLEGEDQDLKRMVLDVVITIVGEVYGQRDLLEERRVWMQLET